MTQSTDTPRPHDPDQLPEDGAARRLVLELQDVVGLDPVDACRSAFTALAVGRGWSKARVGRYLGISRARVGQKVEKLEHYAFAYGERAPGLQAVVARFGLQHPAAAGLSPPVAFDVADWDDLGFARRLIDRVAGA